MKKILIILLIYLFFFTNPTLATTFDLFVSTPGPYNRGQEVTFTININTEGATLNNTAIGMTYDTQYLEYLNTLPGENFSTITTDNLGNGKLVFYGNSPSGFSGQGKYVDVVFKLIAQAPGETELCVLWNPQSTPTPTPIPQATNPPQTTRPPVSGDNHHIYKFSILGVNLALISFIVFLYNNYFKKKRIKVKK